MSARRSAPPRAWQRMLSGRRLDLLDPSPFDVEIADIAHGLARVARWNGQTSGEHAFSVAQHCVIVEEIAVRYEPRLPAAHRLAVLLHDGPEYVIGDMISPFKAVIGENYKQVEARLQAAIHLRFGLPATLPAEVTKLAKTADRVSAYFEAIELAGFSEEEAARFFGKPKGFEPRMGLVAWPTALAQSRFLARFEALETLAHGPHKLAEGSSGT